MNPLDYYGSIKPEKSRDVLAGMKGEIL